MATEINQLPTIEFTYQSYDNDPLMGSIEAPQTSSAFTTSSYIELFVYDNNQNIIQTNYDFTDYTFQNQSQLTSGSAVVNQIIIDPEKTLIDLGLDQGEYNPYYNFLNNKIGSSTRNVLISEISSDRTELRLDSVSLGTQDMVSQTLEFIQERNNSPYFVDFYLNFGENKLVIANNIVLDNQNPDTPTILVKLYQPLPQEFTINSPLWVVTTYSSPIAYQVIFEDTIITVTDTTNISGPNFNLNIKDQVNNSSQNLSYSDLTTTTLTSSLNQLNSLLEGREIDINIDYTNFTEFTHFSSVKTRLENFYYKVSLIEDYSSSISTIITDITGSTSSSISVLNSINLYESKISDIITNFDGYDYYLYYSSGSYSWPKTTPEPPYLLATTGSNAVLTWFGSDVIGDPNYGGIILSASQYDELNPNSLYYSIPEYLRNDPANDQYTLFIDMVGQFYDNIWIYYKDVTQKYNADNRLENGISKDIVADAIRDFGIKLYQNNFSNEDLYTAFLGLTPDGALFPFPNITGSLPTPSGYEYINTLISASNDYMPLDDVNKSLYKRIYHNLPYLLKSKGTLPGLRALITSYGIPDTILRINEYGGKDKANTDDWDYWQNEFNYAFDTLGTNYVSTPWNGDNINPSWDIDGNGYPIQNIQFRFKTKGIPTNTGYYSQSLWTLASSPGSPQSTLRLIYTGSGYTSGSYSGSIADPYNEYALLEFFPDDSDLTTSASIYLPFFNGDWWSTMIDFDSPSTHTLYAGNKSTSGDNSTTYQFLETSSVNGNDAPWTDSSLCYFPASSSYSLGKMFSGSYQEIRYFNTILGLDVFKDYVMNPSSIEGSYTVVASIGSPNVVTISTPEELLFRLPLGGELYTGSNSIHPKVTGSWAITSSFSGSGGFYNNASFYQTPTFVSNTEYFFYDQPAVGIKNAVSDKIRLENNVIPSGDTLSPFRSLAQQVAVSQSYTANTNLLEVAFSPQDEINEDIMDQIGYFNIGELIGDPRLRSSSAESYPLLDTLRNDYFQKYTSNYDLNDFIRLIKFFDNSLFKMIKDFVPVRTSLASGIVIKQHLLERNKYPQPQVNNHSTIAYYPSGSSTNPLNNQPLTFQDISITGTIAPQWNDFQPSTIENFSGGAGGVFNPFNYVNNTSQSWYETIPTISGSVIILHSTQDEFYDGEFSGSNIIVTTQSLATPFSSTTQAFNYKQVHYYGTSSNEENIFENNFLNPVTIPQSGEILFMNNGSIISVLGTNTWVPIYNTKYIKISKVDCNGIDHTIELENLAKIYVYNYLNNTYVLYTITNINELSSCFLYEVNLFEGYTPSQFPNQLFDYYVSGSKTTSQVITTPLLGTYPIISGYTTKTGDSLNYFRLATGIYTLGNTPNTQFSITASITNAGDASIGSGNAFIEVLRNGVRSQLTSINSFTTTSPTTVTISASYYGLQGDQVYVRATKTGFLPSSDYTVTNVQFLLTQSRAVSSSNCDTVIFEPYISTPNYYNSDYNPLINNVEDERLSTVYQDVDYSTGITTPTNFALLISGSALKAAVQDSNYTTKRHIIPRYEGSKSTSQYLNVWTEGDSGTYGKTPTAESLKTMVAYCDSISGWPPERMNASAVHVLYLIKQDGTVVIPNASQNSLADIQGTFMSGENLIITQKTIASGESTQQRNIIRGGTRIEPILYSQYGQAPNALWNTTMSFTDITPSNTGPTGNYTATYTPTGSSIQIYGNTDTKVSFSNTINGLPISNNGYKITSGPISDGVNLTFDMDINYTVIQSLPLQSIGIDIILSIYKNGSPLLDPFNNPISSLSSILLNTFTQTGNISLNNIIIPNSNLLLNDEYTVYLNWIGYTAGASLYINPSSIFKINQYPIFTQPVTSSGVNSIWGWADKTNYPYVITSSQPTFTSLYGDPNSRGVDITGSGFNSITLPWSIKYGDEFRFEGREDFAYQVGKIFGPAESGSGRLFQTGSIEVHLNSNLPVSASSSVFNLDHFAIRRYIDDASLILMEGFKPANASGPYIVRPEYIVPELNKSVDQFILDLTQKGLIT